MNATVSNAISEHVQNMRAHVAFEMLRAQPSASPKAMADVETAADMLECMAAAMVKPGLVVRGPTNRAMLNIAAGAMDACAMTLAGDGELREAAWASKTAHEWGRMARHMDSG